MKHTKSIFLAVLISLFILTGCGIASTKVLNVPPTPIVTVSMAEPLPAQNPLPETGPVVTPTSPAPSPTPVVEITPAPAPTSAPVVEGEKAVVAVSSLNLRLGPGFTYPVAKLLSKDQEVSMIGRSADSLWAEVKLSDGGGGWAFGSYLISDVSIASLPVHEAFGGPNGGLPPVKATYTILVSIENNQASVNVEKFPANHPIVAKLGLPGEEPALEVASGKTDNNGAASLSFDMPSRWEDGTRLNQTELVLEVSTLDGAFSYQVTVVYIK